MTRRTYCAVVVGVLCAVGCGEPGFADAGPPRDAGTVDANLRDGGPGRTDAGLMDAGRDAGGDDADVADGAIVDGGDLDGAPDDGAASDGDAGPDDGGAAQDAGAVDASALGVTPGPGDVVIVEIQGNPQTATDEQAEYIELLNVSGRTLDLAGVRLTHLDWAGGEPVVSRGTHTIAGSVTVAPGARVLLTRSGGGYFGGATRDYVYGGFLFSNGASERNRLRLMVPSWAGTEPPAPADVIDEVKTAMGAFENSLRGRALQLDPARVPSPSAASNDDPTNWCHTANAAARAYWSNNWGTPRAGNACM